MPRLTVTITDEQSDLLDELSGDGGEYESKSAAVRDFIQAGEQRQELHEEIAQLRERLESREQRIDDLEDQLARRSQLEEKIEGCPTKSATPRHTVTGRSV
jgi:Arc/MetJ-type ribon-helix-helix transcriptional regulator